jgi:Ca2+:H+ antiporter
MRRVYYLGVFVPLALVLDLADASAPVFNGYELAALLLTALITVALTADGESTWFEGFQLIAVYGLLGLVFYFA